MNRQYLSLALLVAAFFVLPACWKSKKTQTCEAETIINNDDQEWTSEDADTELFSDSFEAAESIKSKSIFDEDTLDDEDDFDDEIEKISINPLIAIESTSENKESFDVQSKQKIGTIYFDFDRYVIRDNQKAAARAMAMKIENALDASPELRVVLKGHACDSSGSYRYNLQLSDYRAQAYKTYLIQYGIPAGSIEAFGCGTEELIVSHGDRQVQAPNRRVEVFLAHS